MKMSKVPAVIIAELIILVLAFLFAKEATQVAEIAFLLTLAGLILLASYFAYEKLRNS